MTDVTTRSAADTALRTPGAKGAAPRQAHFEIDPEWLDFGTDDPLDADRWINHCANCGAEPVLVFEGAAHRVSCRCGASGTPGRLAFTAAFNWNKSALSVHPHYGEVPFFQLGDLDSAQARAKLNAIRDYLTGTRRYCEARVKARLPVGHRYLQRIRAYLNWSIYALGLVREAELDGAQPVQHDPGTDAAARLN